MFQDRWRTSFQAEVKMLRGGPCSPPVNVVAAALSAQIAI